MAWKGTGRSGIGDQTIIGEYGDWNGLSMNGRQWKSPHTQETRDLSGADYWHMRKALEPKTPEDIPTFVRGVPNIAAFAEPQAKQKAQPKTKSAFDSIMLADRNYERLCGLSEQLDTEFDKGLIDLESWAAARKNIDQRLAKAWARVQRERGWNDQGELLEPEQYPSKGLEFTLDYEPSRQVKIDYSILPADSVFAGLSDGNAFKKIYANLLTGYKALSNLLGNAKQILEEGLI